MASATVALMVGVRVTGAMVVPQAIPNRDEAIMSSPSAEAHIIGWLLDAL